MFMMALFVIGHTENNLNNNQQWKIHHDYITTWVHFQIIMFSVNIQAKRSGKEEPSSEKVIDWEWILWGVMRGTEKILLLLLLWSF